METVVDEIGDRIYRLSTRVEGIVPGGFSFNQFLVQADEPLLFHCGMRGLFPSVSAALARVLPVADLRWISFGHVEADECGALNALLAAAPRAQVVHGQVGCLVSLNDLSDRLPLALEDGATLDLGDRRLQLLVTPHVPHGWETIVLYEEATGTLLGGDVLTSGEGGPPLTGEDLVGPVMEMERTFHAWSLTPRSGAQLRRLAALEPRRIAAMHGSSFEGDGGQLLRDLASEIDALTREQRTEAAPERTVPREEAPQPSPF
jgi:flavorubredoxin